MKKEIKKLYKVCRNVPSWSKTGNSEAIVMKECETLADAGQWQGKLIDQGVITWLEIEENRQQS